VFSVCVWFNRFIKSTTAVIYILTVLHHAEIMLVAFSISLLLATRRLI